MPSLFGNRYPLDHQERRALVEYLKSLSFDALVAYCEGILRAYGAAAPPAHDRSKQQRELWSIRMTDPSNLTLSEERIMLAVASGTTANDDIARALYLSPKTVKNHLHSIYRKLNVPNLTSALIECHRRGIVQIDGPGSLPRSDDDTGDCADVAS